MSKILLVGLLTLSLLACTKNEDCSSSESDLDTWMQELKDGCDDYCCTCTLDIYSAKYNGQEVYYSSFIGSLCDVIFSVQLRGRCGAIIQEYEPGEFDKFYSEVTEQKLIFDCD